MLGSFCTESRTCQVVGHLLPHRWSFIEGQPRSTAHRAPKSEPPRTGLPIFPLSPNIHRSYFNVKDSCYLSKLWQEEGTVARAPKLLIACFSCSKPFGLAESGSLVTRVLLLLVYNDYSPNFLSERCVERRFLDAFKPLSLAADLDQSLQTRESALNTLAGLYRPAAGRAILWRAKFCFPACAASTRSPRWTTCSPLTIAE